VPKKTHQGSFKEITPGDFIMYLKPKIERFVTYNSIANWQDDQCKKMMENARARVFISHIDFAKN
jgi:hypothetical protein